MIFFSTPRFWYSKRRDAICKLLNAALKPIYSALKSNNYKHKPNIHTVAIGGVTIGGAGKTPVARWLYQDLKDKGHTPVICLRGYGRKTSDPIIVDLNKHSFEEVGDEALLLAQDAPVVVSANRKIGHDIALSLGADILILDDGLEQRDLEPNERILVVDGFQGIGNGLLFPFGPLRNTLESSVKLADEVLLLNEDKHNLEHAISQYKNCHRFIAKQDVSDIPHDIIAFSGLGMNEKFFSPLRERFNVVETFGYPDHYPYTAEDIQRMAAKDYQLVTTEKDYFRIPNEMKKYVKVIKQILIRAD